MKLPALALTFKLKILLFVGVMLFIPLLIISIYFYGSLRSQILTDTLKEVKFENKLFTFMVHNSNMYAIREIAYDLQVKEEILKTQSIFVANALSTVERFNNLTLYELIRDNMMKSVNSAKTRFFIYDRNGNNHFFMAQDDKKYLQAINRLKTMNMKRFFDTALSIEKDFTHYFFSYNDTPLLVGVYPSKSRLIVSVEDLSEDYAKYNDASIDDTLRNIEIFVSALSYLDQNQSLAVLDEQEHFLVRTNGDEASVPLPGLILKKAKQHPYWSGSLALNNEMAIACIGFYPAYNWYIAAMKYPEGEFGSLLLNLLRVLSLAVAFAFCGLLLTAMILRSPLTRLKSIAEVAKQIENAGLKNASKLASISDNIPTRKCGFADIDLLVLAFKKMTSSLSVNMQNIIELSNREKRLEGELNAAHNIQAGMLPDNLSAPDFNPYVLESHLLAAKEVGGDLYDAIPVDKQNFAVIIGGVSDKGVPAALFMTMTITLLRQGLSMHLSPAALMTEVNRTLCMHNPNMMNVTLVICLINKSTHCITYANGGHCQPLIVNAQGIRTLTGNSGPALGVMDGRQYQEFTDQLAEDETLFMYTEGLIKTNNPQGQQFGLESLNTILGQDCAESPKVLIEHILTDVKRFRESAVQANDITMLAVKKKD